MPGVSQNPSAFLSMWFLMQETFNLAETGPSPHACAPAGAVQIPFWPLTPGLPIHRLVVSCELHQVRDQPNNYLVGVLDSGLLLPNTSSGLQARGPALARIARRQEERARVRKHEKEEREREKERARAREREIERTRETDVCFHVCIYIYIYMYMIYMYMFMYMSMYT